MSREWSGTQRRVYEVEGYLEERLDMSARMGVEEYQAFGSTFVLPKERRFGGLKEVQSYVDALTSDPNLIARYGPNNHMVVRDSKYSDMARGGQGRMSLPETPEFLRELKVLHEVAHQLGGSGHGDRFREAYLWLVEYKMSEQLAFLMKMYLATGER